MKTAQWILVAALALGLAGSASAAAKTTLGTGNNTVAGPGSTSIAAGGSETIFLHPGNTSDLCTTVVNSGKVAVTVNITGGSSPSGAVSVNGSKAVCADDVTQVDLTCPAEGSDCAAQWRVDDN